MNRLTYRKYNSLLLIAFLLSLTGMRTDTNYLGNVKKVFDVMNDAVVNDKVCYLKYAITTNLNSKDAKGNLIVNTGTFEMITSKSQSRLYSKDMIILKDQKNTFAILPARKVIYWSDAVPSKKGEHLYDQLSTLQDSIFKNVKKQECIEVKDKEYTKIINIDLNEKMSSFLGIKSATYFINDITQRLSKVIVLYQPGNQYTRLEYDFKETDLDYKKMNMNVPVRELVFDNGQKFQVAYQGFQLKDNRKK